MKSYGIVVAVLMGLLLVCLSVSVPVYAGDQNFVVSFGTGGMPTYRVVDNTCFVYTLAYPKEEKEISQLMNNVLTDSINQARKQFSQQNDGLVNMKIAWQFLGKEKIVYQVCGDVVKKTK